MKLSKWMKLTSAVLLGGFVLLVLNSRVKAQDVESIPRPGVTSGSKSKGKKNTSINFEDELIEGDVKKPELLYLLQKKQFNFKRLIKLRENFLPEMRRTAEDLK